MAVYCLCHIIWVALCVGRKWPIMTRIENTKSGGVEAAKADTDGEMVKSRNREIAGFNTRNIV